MTMGEMIEKLYDTCVVKSSKAKLIGSITGSGTINITEITDDYANLTNENFIISITTMPGITTSGSQSGSRVYGKGSGFTVTKSYDASTGILSVSGLVQTIYAWDASGRNSASNQSATANVYLV